MRTMVISGLLLLASCGNSSPSLVRTTVWNLFPFDGSRQWTFTNPDQAFDFSLHAETVGNPDIIGGLNVYAVSYQKECRFVSDECSNGDEVLRIRWSSDSSSGVLIHGYTQNDIAVEFRPAISLAEDTARRGETVETESDGLTWTATFEGIQECPFRSDDWQCAVFSLESTAEEPLPIEGTYWAVGGQNVVAMDLANDFGPWHYIDSDCTDCDGNW